MTDAATQALATAASDARDRALGMASLRFLSDQMRIGVAGLDVTETLLMLAINQANIQPLTREPLSRIRYGGLQAPAPDARRRPVSINAIAGSLALPFETVRRRVAEMTARGIVGRSETGLIVPEAFLSTAEYVESVVQGHHRLIAFFHEANAAGWVGELPRSAYPAEDQIPMRAAARLVSDYMLRSAASVLPLAGGTAGVALFLGVLETDAPAMAPELGRMLGMPPETTRRQLARLTAAGLIRRSGRGHIADAAKLATTPWTDFFRANAQDAHRLFAGLAERGVIEAWTRLAPAPADEGLSRAQA